MNSEELLRKQSERVAEMLRGLPWHESPEICGAIVTAVNSFEAQRELIADLVTALEESRMELIHDGHMNAGKGIVSKVDAVIARAREAGGGE